ncbi:hypothetical protein Trydic_g5911 [Trypoxylus dichotomus]
MGSYFLYTFLLFLSLWNDAKGNECLIACTREMKPVCAQNDNGQVETFPNACNLVVRQCEQPDINWRFMRSGDCIDD